MSTPTFEFSNPFADPSDSHEARLTDDANVTSQESTISRQHSLEGRPRGKKKVGFTAGSETPIGLTDRRPSRLSPPISPAYSPRAREGSLSPVRPSDPESDTRSHLPELSPQQTDEIHRALTRGPDVVRPRPAIRQGSSFKPAELEQIPNSQDESVQRSIREERAHQAFLRGKRLERDEKILSAPSSRRASPDRLLASYTSSRNNSGNMDILLKDLRDGLPPEMGLPVDPVVVPEIQRARKLSNAEAFRLVRSHSDDQTEFGHEPTPGLRRANSNSSQDEAEDPEEYKPPPTQYRSGILGALLKLYNQPAHGEHRSHMHARGNSKSQSNSRRGSAEGVNWSGWSTPQHSPPGSGTATPTHHWYSHSRNKGLSTSSLATLVGSSTSLVSPSVAGLGEQVGQKLKEEKLKRPVLGKRTLSGSAIAALNRRISRPRLEDEIKITKHIAETIQRQRYLLRLCKALMLYGAPTHRLEEYMMMSARVLEIDAQFLYIPGAMIMSFDDAGTHTAEVKLVKVVQGLDLGKLRDVHEVYKEVVHDRLGVEDATVRLKEVTSRKVKFSRLFRIFFYGLAAVCVGPFAFNARLIDLPIAFLLGTIVGVLQLIIAPRSDLYANVFEITAAVITSFLARAFGSIRDSHGDRIFCFSALAQSSIALILPGYTVLCASLELQSRSIVAGSVRMVYAVIYSLILGFGITIGTAVYGIIDKDATSATTCTAPMSDYWFFFFVPGFTLCLIIINQAKWKQAPVMLIVAFIGYIVNYFSSRRFAGNTQVSNSLGAFAIGVVANLYSRLGGRVENAGLDFLENSVRPRWKSFRKRVFHWQSRIKSPKALEDGTASEKHSAFVPAVRRVGYSLAAAAMLPAIFVQVPSGLAVNGSLVSGIASADQITGNATNGSAVVNSTTIYTPADGLNSIVFNVGYSVIQVAIGITVGLFLSAIVVYPVGKRRSGLFSF